MASLSGPASDVQSDEGMLVPQRRRPSHGPQDKENTCKPWSIGGSQNVILCAPSTCIIFVYIFVFMADRKC